MRIRYQSSNKYSSKITLKMPTGVNNRFKKVLVGANNFSKNIAVGASN